MNGPRRAYRVEGATYGTTKAETIELGDQGDQGGH